MGVTGTGGTIKEVDRDHVIGSVAVVEVDFDFFDVFDVFDVTDEFIGGAPDTVEVIEKVVAEIELLTLNGFGPIELLDEVSEVAAVAQDGGVCGASKGVLVLVAVHEELEPSVVTSGLSGPSVTVTQSVIDTVLLLSSAARCVSGRTLVW